MKFRVEEDLVEGKMRKVPTVYMAPTEVNGWLRGLHDALRAVNGDGVKPTEDISSFTVAVREVRGGQQERAVEFRLKPLEQWTEEEEG